MLLSDSSGRLRGACREVVDSAMTSTRTFSVLRLFLISLCTTLFVSACQPDLVDRPSQTPSGVRASDSDTVRFAAIGDFGTGQAEQLAVAETMCDRREENPFTHVVTTGDNIYPEGEVEDFDDAFFAPYECLFEAGVEFHAVLGNHDDDTQQGEAQISEPRFGMPARDYTWRLGPVAFVMFDSQEVERELDEEEEFEEGSSYQWVLDAIEDAQDARWTVAVFHQPVYSAGDLHGSEPGFDEALGEPFARAGVDLVLNGHDHNYQRGEHDGVTYVVTGGGGAELYRCELPLIEQIDVCLEERHFVEVEASPDEMTITSISQEGEILDEAEIEQNE